MSEAESATFGGWNAGLEAVDITPSEPIWLSGWDDRKGPSIGVSQRIFAKAPALKVDNGPVAAAFGVADLSFQPRSSREEIEAMLAGRTGMGLRQVQHQLDKLDAGEPLASGYHYPLQVWRFGSGYTFIIMSSEVVSDYSIRFKQSYGFDQTWVMAYANEHIAYIPSERIQREGGYEGADGMLECVFPSPFTLDIECTIADRVSDLWQQADVQNSHASENGQLNHPRSR